MKQLKDLKLCRQSNYLDEPNAKTETTYKRIFLSLVNLQQLEMAEPSITKLRLSNTARNEGRFGIGDLRCKLLAKNLPGLALLHIGEILWYLRLQ